MTFVPPSEQVTGPPLGETPPGNIEPQNDHPGFTDAEWSEIQANLESHYTEIYGTEAAPQPPQAGTPAEGLGTQQPVVPVIPTEYDLGQVKVSAEDAGSLEHSTLSSRMIRSVVVRSSTSSKVGHRQHRLLHRRSGNSKATRLSSINRHRCSSTTKFRSFRPKSSTHSIPLPA